MNDSTLTKLGVAAGILVVLSVWVSYADSARSDSPDRSGSYLVQKIDPSRVAKVRLREGSDVVELNKQRGGYVLTSRLNYPASTREVNRLFNDVLKIRTVSRVTDDASAHAGLGVAKDGENATVVEFLDTDDKLIVGIVVGESDESSAGFFVRRIDEDTVYRSEEFISLRTDNNSYLNKQLTQNQRDEIAKVTVSLPGEPPYELVREDEDDAEVTMLAMPEGKQFAGRTYETVFGASSYLNFDEFASASEKTDLSFDSIYQVQRHDGALFRFEVATTEIPNEAEAADPEASDTVKEYWLRCSASYAGPTLTRADVANASPEETKRQASYIEAQDAVDVFTQRHQSWVYKISSYKAEAMTKPVSDVLEDIPVGPVEIEARHILIAYTGSEATAKVERTKEEALALANEVLAKALAAPDTFADLAKEYSEGPSAEDGGNLGSFNREKMVPPFTEAAFALEVDAITPAPVETQFGFHIIQRTK